MSHITLLINYLTYIVENYILNNNSDHTEYLHLTYNILDFTKEKYNSFW